MGFLSKLKNVFFEEEEIEVEEKPKKEKPIAKKVELPKREKRKAEEEQITSNEDLSKREQEEEIFTEVEVGETYTPREKKQGFKFPVLLEDDLIEEEIKVEEKPMRRSERKEKVEPLYKEKVETKKVEKEVDRDHPFNNSYTRDLNSVDYSLHDSKNDVKGFKPSPIISPIYGVLDKNYKKEEIHDKKETHTTSFSFTNDKLDLDSVSNNLGILTHESIHYTDALFDSLGLNGEGYDAGDEHYAYLVEWCFNCLLDYVERRKEK